MDNVEKAKDDLQDILNQREYQVYYEDHRSIFQIWWDNIKEWFLELLSNLSISFNPSNGFADTLLIVIIVGVIVVVVLALFLVIRTIRRKRALFEHQPLQFNELEWSVGRHLTEAEKHEQEENYSLATRHMFLALLLYFHEKEWLVAKVWKTNWEYYDELQKMNQKQAKTFYRLAHFFDEVVYGKREIEEGEYQKYRSEIRNLLEETNDELEMKQ